MPRLHRAARGRECGTGACLALGGHRSGAGKEGAAPPPALLERRVLEPLAASRAESPRSMGSGRVPHPACHPRGWVRDGAAAPPPGPSDRGLLPACHPE